MQTESLNLKLDNFLNHKKNWWSSNDFLKKPKTEAVAIEVQNFCKDFLFRGKNCFFEQIKNLNEKGYTLKKPFEVKIEKAEDGNYLGSIKDLGISYQESGKENLIKEIKREILELHDYLVLNEIPKLSKKQKLWKKNLKKHIKYETPTLNKETLQALEDSRSGKNLIECESLEQLFNDCWR